MKEKCTKIIELLSNSETFKQQRFMFVLNHPKIIKTVVFQSMLADSCPTSLHRAMKRKKFTDIKKVFTIYQIAQGMKYIHSHKIVHQNLSPFIIYVYPNGLTKIGRFSKIQLTNFIQNESEIELRMLSDVYSFGVIVYFILSDGEMPDIKSKINVEHFPLLAGQLIDSCCNFEISNRPTFEIICDVLDRDYANLTTLSNVDKINLISNMIKEYKNNYIV